MMELLKRATLILVWVAVLPLVLLGWRGPAQQL